MNLAAQIDSDVSDARMTNALYVHVYSALSDVTENEARVWSRVYYSVHDSLFELDDRDSGFHVTDFE